MYCSEHEADQYAEGNENCLLIENKLHIFTTILKILLTFQKIYSINKI